MEKLQIKNNNKYQYTDLYEDPKTGIKPKPYYETSYEKPPSQFKKKKRKEYWNVKVKANQQIYSGGTLHLTLQENIKNQYGDIIPKGTTISGIVNIENNRLYVHFTSASINHEVVPLNFSLCDIQGIEGIGIKPQKESNNTNFKSNVSGVASSSLSSIPIVGNILGGVVNDVTHHSSSKKESFIIHNSFLAKITTLDNEDSSMQ